MDLYHRLFRTGMPAGDTVRLRTQIYLRWLAVLGQLVAVIVATQYLGIVLRLDLILALIGLSAAFNVGMTLIHPEAKRLNQRDAMLSLMFDLAQLGALLYLTGGVANPFVTLILAQTVVAATVLTLGATLLLAGLSIAILAALTLFPLPLRLAGGGTLEVPSLLLWGSFAAHAIALLFIGYFARIISIETHSMSQALTATQLALEREQKLTALGGVVAAAAHELGTPLATIMLVSREMQDELRDRPELAEDVALIRAQAERCRDILASMGRSGKEDAHLRHAPFSAVVEEAAEPHVDRGPRVMMRIRGQAADSAAATEQPLVPRRSEVVHGVRNLVQNAVDFARTTIWIDLDWTDERLILRVGDDGPGYPSDVLGRIGEPFVRRRRTAEGREPARPSYAGMGLGLFIAKTLLERTGARLTFANGAPPPAADQPAEARQPTGAIVEVVWDRAALEVPKAVARGPLGQNRPVARHG